MSRKKWNIEGWKGGGLFAALLFVATAFAGVASWAFVHAFVAPPDRLAQYVPGHALVYAHASRPASVAALHRASALLPDGVSPEESAVFAVAGDDARRWAAIVSWNRGKPTVEERESLRLQGYEELGEHTYLLGDLGLATPARLALASRTAIADDDARAAALARMAALHGIQTYVSAEALQISELFGDLYAPLAEDFTPEAVVGGVSLHADGIRARVVPESAWNADLRAARGHGQPLVMMPEAFETVFAGGTPTFDAPLLLSGTSSIPKNHPAPAMLSQAAADLQTAVSTRFTLWLGRGTADAQPPFLWHLPDSDSETTRSTIAAYFGTLDPTEFRHTMPDNDEVVEYVRSEGVDAIADDVAFARKDGSYPVFVGSDGRNGLLLANDADSLDAYRAAPRKNRIDARYCETEQMLGFLKTTVLEEAFPASASVFQSFGLIHMIVGISVDNTVYICGYQGMNGG